MRKEEECIYYLIKKPIAIGTAKTVTNIKQILKQVQDDDFRFKTIAWSDSLVSVYNKKRRKEVARELEIILNSIYLRLLNLPPKQAVNSIALI
ncbi:MAG: hypothetical protein M0D57_15240 [Sphingobacteriales bacterium JAD_PAG50586_3]|nr:MAG: hypothetical protein M0D57_15240 [Sphingobacteriales bacterium JAD_PAG50586_3]